MAMFIQSFSNEIISYGIAFRTIILSHKSHNESDKYPAIHHFVTEMCKNVLIYVTKWCIVGLGFV